MSTIFWLLVGAVLGLMFLTFVRQRRSFNVLSVNTGVVPWLQEGVNAYKVVTDQARIMGPASVDPLDRLPYLDVETGHSYDYLSCIGRLHPETPDGSRAQVA